MCITAFFKPTSLSEDCSADLGLSSWHEVTGYRKVYQYRDHN